MVRPLRPLLPALVLLACGCRPPAAGPPPRPAQPVALAGASIEQAAWLAGHWEGEGLAGWNETLWSPPAAGTMMGVFRHIRDGRVVFYEFLTVAPEGGTLVLSIKHFDPDMRGWEEPTRSVRFPLLRASRDTLHFDGLTYRRVGPDRREVTVMLGPDPDDLRPEVFHYRRVRR